MNLPQPFVERMQQLLQGDYEAFAQALMYAEQPVSIRINNAKGVLPPTDARPVLWSGGVGYYLSQRPTFTFDPLFHAGAYYVQEAASMFLGAVIKQYIDAPVRYLDLCAAPGGKSTHALSMLPQGSLVVSNEVVRQRAQILAENITKWGSPYSVVTNNTPADWGRWHNYFDVVAADVPCSGEGMFRKDEQAVDEWSLSNVSHCARRQESILDDVWSALRPGGLLIYSTCTYNLEENENMVQYLVDNYNAEPLRVEIDADWGITGALSGGNAVYRFMPHRTQGEGLFMALLRKPGEADDSCGVAPTVREKKKKGSTQSPKMKVNRDIEEWIAPDAPMQLVASETSVVAYPREYITDMQAIRRDFDVLHIALPVASLKGRDLIPTHALAMSTQLNTTRFPLCEVSLDVALAYLRREAVVLPSDAPQGYVVLAYKGFAIGWVKNLGSRANNLYPQEWRIRSSHTPDVIVDAGVSKRI